VLYSTGGFAYATRLLAKLVARANMGTDRAYTYLSLLVVLPGES